MYHVQHALRLGIILVVLQLPALHHRATVRDLHAVETVFNHDPAFLGIVLHRHGGRSRGGRRYGCRGNWLWIRRRSGRRTRHGRSGLGRTVRGHGLDGWLGPEELRPQDDHPKRQQRSHENSQLGCELVLLPRRVHERASGFRTLLAAVLVGISSHFSGTGS